MLDRAIAPRIRCRDPFIAQRISRVRRAIYAFSSLVFCLSMPVVFVFLGYESTLAMKVVEGLMSFAELMAILYLGAGVIDGMDIGGHVKRRFYMHGPRDEPYGYSGDYMGHNEPRSDVTPGEPV